jgi:hypothetical protein
VTDRQPQIGPDDWHDWPEWAKESVRYSPEVDELKKLTWAEMLPPPPETTPQMRSYIRWKQLTHNGRRTPLTRRCHECGDEMTDEEVIDYHAALGRPPQPDRWI